MRSLPPLAARAAALVTRFRRQRPLRAGSLLVTMLGDSIAPRGGSIALASLIKLAQPFGLTDRLVRTSVGRLALDGWVNSVRSGRASFYFLTAQGRARFSQATQRIYAASPETWQGQWTVVIVPPTLKAKREQVRLELHWLGFGQLTPGVFIHPSLEQDETRELLSSLDTKTELIVLRGAQATLTPDARLVQLGWDLGELGRRYRKLIDAFAPIDNLSAPLSAAEGETAFTLRTLLLHEYRKVHLQDPVLPSALLPDDWAGSDALQLCRRVYARVFAASEAYLSSIAETITGELPPPGEEIYQRFGGLPRLDRDAKE